MTSTAHRSGALVWARRNLFRSPLDALAWLRTHDVDFVFLDVNMPGLTGIQFLASLARPPN